MSYNIYPGWHLRNIIRELVCGYTPSSEPQHDRAERGFQLLRFLSAALTDDQAPASKLLKIEIDMVLKHTEVYLCHEYLEADNNPVYFYEFAARAAAHKLQYLGDAMPDMMFAANYGPALESKLLGISPDQISPTSITWTCCDISPSAKPCCATTT